MPTNKTTPTSSAKIPAKWLAIIVFVLVAYGLCQPFVNRKLGWNWPSLSSVMGFEEKAKPEDDAEGADKRRPASTDKSNKSGKRSGPSDPDLSADSLEQQLLGGEDDEQTSSAETISKQSSKSLNPNGSDPKKSSQDSSRTASDSKTPVKSDKNSSEDSKLLYGFLRDLGREDYVSPAGLHYTRGSEQGHRLKHIERHLEDDADRPGAHGVFDGDMAQVVRWIDDAYTRAKQGSKGTSKEEGDLNRTIYEASFSKSIGYIGGREGNKQKLPSAKRLRLVVDERDRVVTAFPF
ncbi:MAG: hypothetical protein U0930_19090 [Pirellulales bacterium]